MYSMVTAPFYGQDVLVLVLILCCWSLLWVWPRVEPEAAQPLEYQTITCCIWKEKLQSTDASALLELCAWSAGWLLNCHMLCANIPANVGQGDFGSVWQSPCTVLQKNLLVPPPWPLPGCPASWSRVEMSCCHHLEAGMLSGEKKGRMDYSFLNPSLPSGERQTDKHEIIMEIKTNTQNIWHWVKGFSWASGLCFALLFHLGENQHFMEKCFPISFA